MKRWSTVLDFIASGKAPTSETVVSFEGWATKGDGGNSLWVKTGGTDTPSQTPTVRGNNTLTDSAGFVYAPVEGAIFYYDGSNDWFPSPFGGSGNGAYQFNGVDWDFLEASVGPLNDPLTTQGLIASSLPFSAGDVITTTGFTSDGDGCGASLIATSTTGLSPSLSFADTAFAYITDATGRRWDLVTRGNQYELWKMGAKQGQDITALLTCAVNEIANNGGTIVLPYAPESNPCIVSGQTLVRSNIKVCGLGRSVSWVKVADNSNINAFFADRRVNVEFSDFSIDGNKDNQTGGQGINSDQTDRTFIRNMTFKNIYNVPILLRDLFEFQVDNIYIEGGGVFSNAISLSNCVNGTISNINSKDYIGACVNISASNGVTVSNISGSRDFATIGWTSGRALLRCTNGTEGVSASGLYGKGYSRGVFVLSGSNNISVSNFTIEDCENVGVWVEGNNGTVSGTLNVSLMNGTIRRTGTADPAADSIFLSDTSGCVISGVVCDNDITETNVNATSDKNIITGNRVLGAITTVGVNTVVANNIQGP